MSKHTYEQWFQHHQQSTRICDGNHDSENGCHTIAEVEIVGMERDEALSRAVLIAAAPDLLEALQEMVIGISEGSIGAHRIQAAIAAIAKATGKEKT